MVQGIALNNELTLGDFSVHVSDASGALRVFVPPQRFFFVAGDSVSVFGQVSLGTGNLPVLSQNINLAVIANRAVPAPLAITTARAATGDNGQRDAAFVRVTNAVLDTVSAGGARQYRLNDGSGFVDLVPPSNMTLPASGTRVDLSGLLVPVAPGRWVIRPRSSADVTIRP
jgi:hypothetical protein